MLSNAIPPLRSICSRLFAHEPVLDRPVITPFEELCWSIQCGLSHTPIQLLTNDPSLAVLRDRSGNTPLHYLAHNFNRRTYLHLIQAGSDVAARGAGGRTLLHLITDHRAVGILVSDGADIEQRCDQGQTPLMAAVQDRHRIDVVHALCVHGANINAQPKSGNSVRSLARLAGNVEALDVLNRCERSACDAQIGTAQSNTRQPTISTHSIGGQ